MANLTLIAKDLVNKINDIALFGGRVGMTLGGTEGDPTLSKLEAPYAWVVLSGSQTDSQDRERWTRVRYKFTVFVSVSYGLGENDFTEQQLTLIETVGQAVTGTQVNALAGPVKWAFDGMTFADGEPNVIKYAFDFSVPSFYTQST